jgi:hypothetical protein
MYNDDKTSINVLDDVKTKLVEKYGKIESQIEYDFDFTDYYSTEMGSKLKKILFVFKDLIDREKLSEIKTYTNTIEDSCCIDPSSKKTSLQGRKINLDPGYLSMHNVVLASAKELPHKVYLNNGIFADVVLEFKNKSFQSSAHTFPDYKTDIVISFLNMVRAKYKNDKPFDDCKK